MPRSIMERSDVHSRKSKAPSKTDFQRKEDVVETFQPRILNTEDLDIPTFLRNRVR
jgi:hypothetical protein